jgi:hypothetical protein
MSRSGARDTAEVWQVIAFLDSEYQNEYASIADCLGANSQLEKPYPTLELEKGDALLEINDKDIRHKSNDFVRKLIEDEKCNKQECSQDTLKNHTIRFTYIKSNDFKSDRHLSSKKVIMVHQIKYILHCKYFCCFISSHFLMLYIFRFENTTMAVELQFTKLFS